MGISSHASRWLIAAVAAPILIWIIFFAPRAALLILVGVAGGLAWLEYLAVVFGSSDLPLKTTALAGWLAVILGTWFFGEFGQTFGLVLAVALGCLLFLLRYPKTEDVIGRVARLVLGHAYLSLFLSFLLLIFKTGQGPTWILFTLLVTFLSDTFAYYAGRTYGKHPLYPAVSPKKTWEGLAGSVVGGMVVATVTAAVSLDAPLAQVLALGAFMGLWQALGDLFESMLKRAAGVKDSGRLLMGHGGLWDRIDALLFNAPLVYVFIKMIDRV